MLIQIPPARGIQLIRNLLKNGTIPFNPPLTFRQRDGIFLLPALKETVLTVGRIIRIAPLKHFRLPAFYDKRHVHPDHRKSQKESQTPVHQGIAAQRTGKLPHHKSTAAPYPEPPAS